MLSRYIVSYGFMYFFMLEAELELLQKFKFFADE